VYNPHQAKQSNLSDLADLADLAAFFGYPGQESGSRQANIFFTATKKCIARTCFFQTKNKCKTPFFPDNNAVVFFENRKWNDFFPGIIELPFKQKFPAKRAKSAKSAKSDSRFGNRFSAIVLL
jgi:hypothetical protein